nr:PREDICTED: cytochrome P450 2B19-like [Apteryx mantelli mantelli]
MSHKTCLKRGKKPSAAPALLQRVGIEEHVQEETGLLLQRLAESRGQPLNPGVLLSAAVGNAICRVLFGKRFNYSDPEYLHILRLLAENFLLESSIAGQLYNMLPGLMDLLPGPHQTFFRNNKFILDFLARKITEHEATAHFDAPQDFTDAFLRKIEQAQRCLDFVPLGFIRTVRQDTQLWGFTIPKGCTIYPVLSSALQDPQHFRNPEVFDPGHFLDETGAFRKNEAFLPFSAGCSQLGRRPRIRGSRALGALISGKAPVLVFKAKSNR